MTNDATRLFGLDGVEVVGVEVAADDIPMLALVTCDRQARCRPGCGIRSERPHSWVRTRPRDLTMAGRRTDLTWTKRRWRCLNQRCGRKTFTESRILRGLRLQGERGFALPFGRWKALRHVTMSPRRIDNLMRATLVLTQFEHKIVWR